MRFIVLVIFLSLVATSCSSSNETSPVDGSPTVVTSVVTDSITTLYERVEDAVDTSEETVPQTPSTDSANGGNTSSDSSEVTETTAPNPSVESTIPATDETTTTTTTTTTIVVPQFDDEMLTEEPYNAENFDESVEPNA